jgi:hypothetical protein
MRWIIVIFILILSDDEKMYAIDSIAIHSVDDDDKDDESILHNIK